MAGESTHLLFDGKKAIISPDIAPVFAFLNEIDKEIESFLGFQKKLDKISRQYLDMINFVQFLSQKLKENNIDFKYKFKEHPEKIAKKLDFHIPLRSQMIVLFASLDVLFNLHTSYKNETSDRDEIRRLTMDTKNTKKFLNEFVLNEENLYYKNNRIRLLKVDSFKLIKLRNSLTHFFSLSGGLFVIPELLKEKIQTLEKFLKENKHGNKVPFSPEDLRELTKSAYHLIIKKWSDNFQNNPIDFKRKIQFVVDIVKEEGATIVLYKDLVINS